MSWAVTTDIRDLDGAREALAAGKRVSATRVAQHLGEAVHRFVGWTKTPGQLDRLVHQASRRVPADEPGYVQLWWLGGPRNPFLGEAE